MSSGLRVAALCLSVALSVVACGKDEPLAAPPTASDVASPSASPSSSPSLSPLPSPSPSPSPSPLSAFEADPAVQGLRAYLAAVTEAVNAKNLQLPALGATATANRAGAHQELFGGQIGRFYPGPNPLAILEVRVVSDRQRNILGCVVTGGFVLDRPDGTPVVPRKVRPGQYDMRLAGGVWKVNDLVAADAVSCEGVPIPGFTS